jgi:hypothetical protein
MHRMEKVFAFGVAILSRKYVTGFMDQSAGKTRLARPGTER